MNDILKKIDIIWLFITFLGCLQGLIGYQYILGWLLGCLISCICYIRIKLVSKKVLINKVAKGVQASFGINYILMAIGLIISAKWSNYCNVFSCFLGLLSIKISIYITEIT